MHKTLRPNEVQRVVEYLGFKFKVAHGSHWHFKKEGVGKVTIPQYDQISDDLFMHIRKQAKITKKEFWEIHKKLK